MPKDTTILDKSREIYGRKKNLSKAVRCKKEDASSGVGRPNKLNYPDVSLPA